MSALPCPPELWPAFSAALDTLLALPATERAGWLATQAPAALHEALGRALQSLSALDTDPHFLSSPAPGGSAANSGPASAELRAGQRIGPYELLAELGRGGMAVVWRARRADGVFERELALKLPHAHLLAGSVTERFERERRLLARLEHPHIARFLDAGLDARGQPYLALEIVQGQPITDWCDARLLPLRERLALLLQAAEALAHAHAQLVVHRDLKPAHVLVDDAGQVKLLDFGIAKLLDGDSEPELTRQGAAPATPRYAAPEQLAGQAASTATDVHALGLLLHELICGRLPAPGRSPLPSRALDAGSAARLSDSLPALRRQLRGDLDAIVATALQPEPAARYASVSLLAADLRAWLAHEPVLARRPGRWHETRLFLRRHWSRLLPLALLALGLLAALALATWQAREAARQARHAEAASAQLLRVLTGADPRRSGAQAAGERSVKATLDEGLSTLLKTRDLAPETLEALLNHAATVYVYLDEPLQAVHLQQRRVASLAERLPRDDESLLDARLSLVWALQAAEQNADAGAQIEALEAISPRAPGRLQAELQLARHDQARLQAATAPEREALLDAARRLYRQHAPQDNGHAAVLLNLGELRLAAGDALAALALFDEGLALRAQPEVASQRARLLAGRGRAALQQGDAGAARRDSLAALALMRGSLGLDKPGSWGVLAQALQLLCTSVAEADALLAEVPAAQRQAFARSWQQVEAARADCAAPHR